MRTWTRAIACTVENSPKDEFNPLATRVFWRSRLEAQTLPSKAVMTSNFALIWEIVIQKYRDAPNYNLQRTKSPNFEMP